MDGRKKSKRLALIIYLLVLTALYLLLTMAANAETANRQVCPDCFAPEVCLMIGQFIDPNLIVCPQPPPVVPEPNQPVLTDDQLERLRYVVRHWLDPVIELRLSLQITSARYTIDPWANKNNFRLWCRGFDEPNRVLVRRRFNYRDFAELFGPGNQPKEKPVKADGSVNSD